MKHAERIAEVTLYEGYLLFPYRRSALKNQQRWTYGGVYPRLYSGASGGHDPWRMQTQCLVGGTPDTEVEVKVRFLHVVDRVEDVTVPSPLDPLSLTEGEGETRVRLAEGEGERPWEEAIERTVVAGDAHPLRLGDLAARARTVEINIPAGQTGEPDGPAVRRWQALRGRVEIAAEPVAPAAKVQPHPACYRLTVVISNTTPWPETLPSPPPPLPQGARGDRRPPSSAHITPPLPPSGRGGWGVRAPIRQTFISTHTILRVEGGAFVSLLEPPPEYQAAADACVNVKTWPVLVEEPDGEHIVLSSPIILYDFPRIAPESPGDLFDATEIDELLRLSILTLTDEEKREMRAADPRAREILERTEALTPEQLMQLHGTVRELRRMGG